VSRLSNLTVETLPARSFWVNGDAHSLSEAGDTCPHSYNISCQHAAKNLWRLVLDVTHLDGADVHGRKETLADFDQDFPRSGVRSAHGL
jgi:hypothetical protein